MPKIIFEVDDTVYTALLSKGHLSMDGRDKLTCECIITTSHPTHSYAGVCVKNPNDGMKYDEQYGFRLAFKRALFFQYVIEQLNKDKDRAKSMRLNELANQWFDYWQKFRVPFGKALHEWYESDEFPF